MITWTKNNKTEMNRLLDRYENLYDPYSQPVNYRKFSEGQKILREFSNNDIGDNINSTHIEKQL